MRILLFALPLASILVCAQTAAAQTSSFFAPLRASQLNGLKVEDIDGEKVGTLHNLVLDMQSGELKFAVIASGGLLGVHPTLKLAPSRIMSAATTKRGTLAVFTTTGIWKEAPVFKPSELASLENPERSQEISRYFQPSGAQAMTPNGRHLSRTGGEKNSARLQLRLASDIIGERVVNPKQEKIGEVLDVLVGFGPPHPAFAVIGTGRLFLHGQKYVVALSALKSMERGKKFMLEVDDIKWQNAQPFSEAAWNSPVTEGAVHIYTYSKTEN